MRTPPVDETTLPGLSKLGRLARTVENVPASWWCSIGTAVRWPATTLTGAVSAATRRGWALQLAVSIRPRAAGWDAWPSRAPPLSAERAACSQEGRRRGGTVRFCCGAARIGMR